MMEKPLAVSLEDARAIEKAAQQGKIQVIVSPPGFEAFFEEVDVLARQGPPDMGQIVALAGKYGVEFLGPPPN